MFKAMLVFLCVLCAAPAWAVYDDATVVAVSKQADTVNIVVNFSGLTEVVAQRSVVLPWNYTDDQLTEWSVSTLEKLNGLKSINTRIKPSDKLPVVRPIEPVIVP